MKLISPVDNLSEVPRLLEAGADELYGGLVPRQWREAYSLLASINQRTFDSAQLQSFEELGQVIDRVHDAGKTFSLTLNAPFYTDQQMPLLLDYIDQVADLGVDGIILADLGLLRIVRERQPKLELHASTLAHLMNSEAVRFYEGQGIQRVVFPRHLTTSEMAEVMAKVPGMRFDAFMLIGKCPNTEGLCTFHHSSPDKIWPCEIPYRIEPLQAGEAGEVLQNAMMKQAGWSRTNRRHGCGLCAIPQLKRMGIYGLKLVGRGAPSSQKVINLHLVRDFLALAQNAADFAVYREKAIKAHSRRFGSPCSPNVCYYPEFYQSE